MSSKPALTVAKVKTALTNSNGYIAPAAKALGRCRQTVAKFIKAHSSLVEFKEELYLDSGDLYQNTLHKMALGQVAYEKTVKNDDGEITVDYYTQAPHFPALKLALEITGIYTPRQENINKNENKLVDTFRDIAKSGSFTPINDIDDEVK